MAVTTLLSTELPDLLPMTGRSPGLHVSEVISDLCRITGVFKPGGADNLTDTWAQCGCAWEDAMIRRFHMADPGRYVSLGELEHDGMYLTPDLYDCADAEPIELKFSWLSPRDDPEDEKLWRYRVQLMAYAAATGGTSGKLSVTFVAGNRRGGGPEHRLWRFQWTAQEIAENWALLRSHGDRMLRDGYQTDGQRAMREEGIASGDNDET